MNKVELPFEGYKTADDVVDAAADVAASRLNQ